jgi:hypothetical protein
MSHYEYRDFAGELGSYNLHEVGEYARGRSCVSFLGGLFHASTKTSLIIADNKNASLGETGEQVVVALDMVAEAVDKDELGHGAAFRLWSGSANVSS